MKTRMVFRTVFVAVLMLVTALAAPQTEPASGNPLNQLAWLVGGKWIAEGDKGPDGKPFHVESTITWGENERIIRFTTLFRVDGKPVPVYSGVYAWHPAKQKFVFLYTDNEGSLTEGEAVIEGDRLEQEFQIVGGDGGGRPFRSIIVRRGPDDYDWNVLRLKDGKWVEVLALRYKRYRG